MTREFIYNYIKRHKLAVISTVSPDGAPEAAVIGIAVTEELVFVFDTVKASRKYHNLLQNPKVALVIGWENDTIQLEGAAEELTGKGSDDLKEIYFSVFEDGRTRVANWPDIVYFKVTPTWLRYSNFDEPVLINEMRF